MNRFMMICVLMIGFLIGCGSGTISQVEINNDSDPLGDCLTLCNGQGLMQGTVSSGALNQRDRPGVVGSTIVSVLSYGQQVLIACEVWVGGAKWYQLNDQTYVSAKYIKLASCQGQNSNPSEPDQPVGSDCVTPPPNEVRANYNACGNGGTHYGIDYSQVAGDAILAGVSGKAYYVTGRSNCVNWATRTCSNECYNKGFNFIKVLSDQPDAMIPDNDLYVYYLHISSINADLIQYQGQEVKRGEVIAFAGNSGCSFGSHTHLEVVSVPREGNSYLHSCYRTSSGGTVNPGLRFCQ